MTQVPTDDHVSKMDGDDLLYHIKQWGDHRKLTDPMHSSAKVQGLKLISEMGELADNLAKGKDVKDDIGDCMVVLVMIARLEGHSIIDCLRVAYNDIKNRKGIMHEGVFIKESDPRYAELIGLVEVKASNGDPTKFSSGSLPILNPEAVKVSFLDEPKDMIGISLDGMVELFQESYPNTSRTVMQQRACSAAMYLADQAKESWNCELVTSGYYKMYSEILAATDYNQIVQAAWYLFNRASPTLDAGSLLEFVEHGFK